MFLKESKYRLEELVELYGNDVLKLAYLYVKDENTAQDISQDVFIKVYKNLKKFSEKSSIKTWIIRITINTCKDYLKSAWAVRVSTYDEVVIEDYDDFDKIEEEERKNILLNAVMNLPERFREVILLYYYKELDTNEIGVALNIPSASVRTYLTRARNMLSEKLQGKICYDD